MWLSYVKWPKGKLNHPDYISTKPPLVHNNLVGGLELEFYDFPYIGNNHPNWLSYFFQRGRYTTNQYWLINGDSDNGNNSG